MVSRKCFRALAPAARRFAAGLSASLLFAGAAGAADLAAYRDVRLGMDIQAVAAAFHINPATATTVQGRPAVLQEMECRPERSAAMTDSETVESIVFSFYNGKMYRFFITYDQDKTEGLTRQDVVEALSAVYGKALRPAATIRTGASMRSYARETVVARWEDDESSVNLVQPDYPPNYALVVFSKSLEGAAEAARAEALRLDTVEAPQRERERMTKEAAELQAKADKARLANKPKFKP